MICHRNHINAVLNQIGTVTRLTAYIGTYMVAKLSAKSPMPKLWHKTIEIVADGDANSNITSTRMVLFNGKGLPPGIPFRSTSAHRPSPGTSNNRTKMTTEVAHHGTTSRPAELAPSEESLCCDCARIARPSDAESSIAPNTGTTAPVWDKASPKVRRGLSLSTNSALCSVGLAATATAAAKAHRTGLTISLILSNKARHNPCTVAATVPSAA
mmetsp:Transcript_107825/g.344212  ORF Transcript_107825/g.344212 Transcript_107825/m.344212 type:complete len:213 (-) Transcript_107825:748-1386(-)